MGRSRSQSLRGLAQLRLRSLDTGLPTSLGHMGWRCFQIASAAREPHCNGKKQTPPAPPATRLPLPLGCPSSPPPIPTPYLPKCPTWSKISSKLPDPMVRSCSALGSRMRQTRSVPGAVGTQPRPAPRVQQPQGTSLPTPPGGQPGLLLSLPDVLRMLAGPDFVPPSVLQPLPHPPNPHHDTPPLAEQSLASSPAHCGP